MSRLGKKIGDYGIGTRLNLGFVLVILMTLGIGIVALFQIGMLSRLLTDIYEHPLTVGYTARDIRGDFNAMHDLVRRISFAEDPVEVNELERRLNEMEAQVFRYFDIIDERYLGPKEDAKVARLAFSDWRKLRAEELRRIRTEGLGKLDKAFLLEQQDYVESLKAKIQKIVDFSGWKAKDFLEAANEGKAQARTAMVGLILGSLLFGLSIAYLISQSISPPLQLVVRRMKDIAGGDLRHEVDIYQKDEIGALADSFREMQASLRDKAEVASAIAAGDFSRTVEIRGPADMLGKAINTMTASLKRARAESERQDWLKTGKNELSSTIVGESDTRALAKKVISFLAGYLRSQIGTVYLVTDDGALSLSGSFAFSKRKSLSTTIEMGEGLVGQAAIEKDIISITGIPDDYIRINSSFGDSAPRNIVAVPLLFEDSVKGVIELGSFEELSDEKLDFLRDVSSTIAVAFHTVQSQTRLKDLLEKTQLQAAQLQVQEEELRTANEELEEQTRSLKQSEDKLKQQQEELQVINEELEEKNDYLEKQKGQIAQKNEELEKAGRELENRARELEVTSKYKSEFLANMSHELRTPLNSLLLLSRDLADNAKGNLSEDQVESAKHIQRSGIELLQLIDEILDLSKIEAGRMILKIDNVDLKDLARYVEGSFKHIAVEKGLGFEVTMGDALPQSIKTDTQRLQQIMKNLISNAIKFTEEGSVAVSFHRPHPETNLSRSGLTHDRAVSISVKDTGIGIPEDKQMLIFEAFQQVEGGTARRYGGTGLGLSISRELARLLGGEIQLVSRPGEGSIFTLQLPEELLIREEDRKALPSRRPAPAEAAVPRPRLRAEPVIQPVLDDRSSLAEGDRTILIIEDDPGFAKILLDQCRAKGFKGLVASSGEAGLEFAENVLPDAVILDIMLPGMNGWTVLNALKENPATRHIPVHIMSVEETSIDALHKGAIGFLTKPVNREELEGAFVRIEEMVEKRIKDLLLVEDSPAQRLGIVSLIGDSDVDILEVESGADALAALRKRNFDCMILDLGLPDMSGFELLKKMEEQKDMRVPPVIVYTGKELSREEEQELRRHAESIIIKGVRSEDRLLDEVALFLHKTVSTMSPGKRQIIIDLHDRDAMLAGRTVLLVDDDMRNLFALSKILTERGMRVLKAEDGMKAIELLEEHAQIELVLLDIMMPIMDGYETAREIRRQRRFQDLPIIALTAKAMKEDRDKCIAAGASDYLAKPVDIERLLSMLRVWLYKRTNTV